MENETIETKVREVLAAEIERQLGQRPTSDGEVHITGTINLEEIAVAVTAALAGGP